MLDEMKKVQNKNNTKKLWIVSILGIVVFFFLILSVRMYVGDVQIDKQCLTAHTTHSTPPTTFETAKDFFDLGNYDYDRGDCTQAIVAYSKAISLNTNFAEGYNNRAYTYMRMRNYPAALSDLNKAIALRPNYVNALMNRGDIYNFYYNKNRQKAIADYDRVISLISPDQYQSLSVCGHRMIAMQGGMNVGILFEIMAKGYNVGCEK